MGRLGWPKNNSSIYHAQFSRLGIQRYFYFLWIHFYTLYSLLLLIFLAVAGGVWGWGLGFTGTSLLCSNDFKQWQRVSVTQVMAGLTLYTQLMLQIKFLCMFRYIACSNGNPWDPPISNIAPSTACSGNDFNLHAQVMNTICMLLPDLPGGCYVYCADK